MDRRAENRVSVELLANVFREGAPVVAVARDLTARGAALRPLGPMSPPPGTELDLELEIPGSRVVFATGRVTSVVGRRLGLTFDRISDADAESIRGYLDP